MLQRVGWPHVPSGTWTPKCWRYQRAVHRWSVGYIDNREAMVRVRGPTARARALLRSRGLDFHCRAVGVRVWTNDQAPFGVVGDGWHHRDANGGDRTQVAARAGLAQASFHRALRCGLRLVTGWREFGFFNTVVVLR